MKESSYFNASLSGTFQLGLTATAQNATPEQEGVYDDEAPFDFNIAKPIVQMFINVTWNQHHDVIADSELANAIDIDVESPSGATRMVHGAGSNLSLELGGATDFGSGAWSINIFGRSGANITWETTVWALLDLNPFRDIEAPYLE